MNGDSAPRGAAPQRVFFALWPDAATLARLHALAGEVHARCGGRRMRRDTLHLTLAFIGDVAPERVAELVAIGDRLSAAPFTLGIDRLGSWRHNRIAWAGASVVPEALSQYVGALGDALDRGGFPTERRAYVPHITLVRRIASVFPACEVEPLDWPARRIALVRSQREAEGARYAVLAEWPVGSATGG